MEVHLKILIISQSVTDNFQKLHADFVALKMNVIFARVFKKRSTDNEQTYNISDVAPPLGK